MNRIFYIALIVSILFATVFGSVDQTTIKYTTKYDSVDIDKVIRNERLLKNYVNCLLDKGSCTPDGQELKKNMPDALESDCSKCSQKQKEGSEKLIEFLIDNRPEYWRPLQDKYDPTGKYREKYLKSKQTKGEGENSKENSEGKNLKENGEGEKSKELNLNMQAKENVTENENSTKVVNTTTLEKN